MFGLVVSVVNGELAFDESIGNEMSEISKMLCCLNSQLDVGRVPAHYVLHYLMAIGALSFRLQSLDLFARIQVCTMRRELAPSPAFHIFSCGDSNRRAEWHI